MLKQKLKNSYKLGYFQNYESAIFDLKFYFDMLNFCTKTRLHKRWMRLYIILIDRLFTHTELQNLQK